MRIYTALYSNKPFRRLKSEHSSLQVWSRINPTMSFESPKSDMLATDWEVLVCWKHDYFVERAHELAIICPFCKEGNQRVVQSFKDMKARQCTCGARSIGSPGHSH